MNPNVSAFSEPLDEHFETVLGELVTELCGLLIVMTKVPRCVIFPDAAPVQDGLSRSSSIGSRGVHTVLA